MGKFTQLTASRTLRSSCSSSTRQRWICWWMLWSYLNSISLKKTIKKGHKLTLKLECQIPHCLYRIHPLEFSRKSLWPYLWRPLRRWPPFWRTFPWKLDHVRVQTPHPPPFSLPFCFPSHWKLPKIVNFPVQIITLERTFCYQ